MIFSSQPDIKILAKCPKGYGRAVQQEPKPTDLFVGSYQKIGFIDQIRVRV